MKNTFLIKHVVGLIIAVLITGCAEKQIHIDRPVLSLAAADFNLQNGTDKTFYFDKYRKALAINAGNSQLRDVFISANKTLGQSFPAGKYRVQLTSITEEDGESSYRIYKNKQLIQTVTNPETQLSFETVTHKLGTFEFNAGDVITVEANAVTNGKIPEGDITAYARGRWLSLTLFPSQ